MLCLILIHIKSLGWARNLIGITGSHSWAESSQQEGMAVWWGQDSAELCCRARTDSSAPEGETLATTICRQQTTRLESLDLFFGCSGSCWLQQQLVEVDLSCLAGTQKALWFPPWLGYVGVMEALLCNSLQTWQKWLYYGEPTVCSLNKPSPETWIFIMAVSCL